LDNISQLGIHLSAFLAPVLSLKLILNLAKAIASAMLLNSSPHTIKLGMKKEIHEPSSIIHPKLIGITGGGSV
jgi:hypothetical protein